MEFDVVQGLTYLIAVAGFLFGTAGLAKYRKAKRIVAELLILARDVANLITIYKAAAEDHEYTDEELKAIGKAAVPIAEAADKYI